MDLTQYQVNVLGVKTKRYKVNDKWEVENNRWDRWVWYSKKLDQFVISDSWNRIHAKQPLDRIRYVPSSFVIICEIGK